MLVALSMTFMTMYVVNFLLSSTKESFQTLLYGQTKNVGYMSLSMETLGVQRSEYSDEEIDAVMEEKRQELIEKMEAYEGIDHVYFGQTMYASYNALVGNLTYDFPLLSPEEIPGFLKHMNAKLIDGRMPEGDGEILVDEKVFMNEKLKLGGYFNENTYGKVFKVVGILQSDIYVCTGTPCGFANSGWQFTVECNEKTSDLKKVLADIGYETSEYDSISDYPDSVRMYKENIAKEVDIGMTSIVCVVMVFLTLSILVANISFMRSRVNEYCLYASIGYGRKQIYGMMIREILLMFGIAIGIGILLSGAGVWLIAETAMKQLGLSYRYIDSKKFWKSVFRMKKFFEIIACYVAIIGLLQIPMALTIHRIKTVDLIEES